jgi:hypothetical protein
VPKHRTIITVTSNSLTVSARDRVFTALIHTEHERVGAGLTDRIILWWRFPLSCCEASKDEILGSLNDSQSPFLFLLERDPSLITTSMEVFCFPSISGSIIYSLESSLRILVSNKFHDHLPMGRGPKSLRISKIC